jgi:hypothetical protein
MPDDQPGELEIEQVRAEAQANPAEVVPHVDLTVCVANP